MGRARARGPRVSSGLVTGELKFTTPLNPGIPMGLNRIKYGIHEYDRENTVFGR